MKKNVIIKYVRLLFCLNIIILSSCEKDITIDYHSVAPIYVVEATVSNVKMEARISRTQDMGDNSTRSDINNATVVITGDDGSRQQLSYLTNGRYNSKKACRA